ncbi:B-cell linker protein [Frankliniella fusca]|uniref:B-cell linker protein n=1 Tax=Frankliniella fusca TaxID=407009 RepID=A0AAE1I2C2_9NEOP|nr:B-cell linker protein [Frankliniella fusca]
MQKQSASSPISNNGNVLPGGTMYCSTSTLSDSGSWDTDFDDDQNSESSGFYGDVGAPIGDKPETQTKPSGVGRVAALAKTVAASLAASGHSGPAKFQKPLKKNETDDSRGTLISSERQQIKTVMRSSKVTSNGLVSVTNQHGSFHSDKPLLKDKPVFTPNNLNRNSFSGLPKPPGPESEQVQQVIGALGQLWSSDSMSLSSQTQSDDDYEPMQSDSSSPQLSRLSPHPVSGGSQYISHDDIHRKSHSTESHASIPDLHSSTLVHSFLHSSTRSSEIGSNNSAQPKNSQVAPQSVPFLHSSAAAAALAAAAASAATCRLSQSSKRSSGCDSVYSPSSGSSISETSHQTGTLNHENGDGVYEPIEEKQKVNSISQKSFLHSSQSPEKCDGKRLSTVKSQASDPRPPVPNRPLPPTPRSHTTTSSSSETFKGGVLISSLESQPWFHNVNRKQAEELIKNGTDGYFLIRPSSQSQNLLTLTLLFHQRVYNISVRQRKDGRIALGFEKPDEQSFSSIEEMINNYHSENLLLFSRNERTGRTVLTKSPPKQI